jgi:2-dehydro-3-deoxyphosphogluconate aldolase/(4S)-4-hydroxy-2-oxoglutarate aldolase
MQAGSLDPDKASLLDLFGAGVVAAGMVSKRITNDLLETGDWIVIKARARRTMNLIAKTRSDLA